MANSERIHIDLASIGTTSAKAAKTGPGMGKSKAFKGSKVKGKSPKKPPTPVKPPSKPTKPGKGKP
tara:strand:- start:102 stop:299 length:198 start_codon:yes stop_codon:yes gene_type:complete